MSVRLWRWNPGGRPLTFPPCCSGTVESPEWRKGPDGPKSLCNACGECFRLLGGFGAVLMFLAHSRRPAIRETRLQDQEGAARRQEVTRALIHQVELAPTASLRRAASRHSPFYLLPCTWLYTCLNSLVHSHPALHFHTHGDIVPISIVLFPCCPLIWGLYHRISCACFTSLAACLHPHAYHIHATVRHGIAAFFHDDPSR